MFYQMSVVVVVGKACLTNKQIPHGACKCFCTTCKAFLEVASKKKKKKMGG